MNNIQNIVRVLYYDEGFNSYKVYIIYPDMVIESSLGNLQISQIINKEGEHVYLSNVFNIPQLDLPLEAIREIEQAFSKGGVQFVDLTPYYPDGILPEA